MTNARWPNALWSDKSVFNNTFWAKSDITSTRGTMVDNGSADLAASGLNMTGAMAVLNIGSYNTFAKQVLWHEPNGNNFTYEDDVGNIVFKPKNNQYFLDSKLELLDNPGEWFYEKETQKLYFIPPNGGACPDRDSGKLRGRTVTHSLVIRTTKNLFLKNLDFFASNVEAVGLKKNEDEIDEINLDSINFFYPSSSKRMLQDNAVPQRTKLVAKMHGSISVVNCTFFGAEGSALYYWSKKSKIHNNLFAWNDWSGHMGQKKNGGYGTVYSSPTSKDEEFIGNTLWYNGASAGYRSGKTPMISDNLVVGQGDGEIMHDGSGIQLQTEGQIGSKILRNWVYDSPKYAIRFDHSTNDPDNLGHSGEMSNNVVWNTMGMMVKGNNHTIESNLALDNTEKFEHAGSLLVIHILRTENVVQNQITAVKNNAATRADGGTNMNVPWPYPRWPLAGITENNYSGEDLNKLLVDVDNKDFRPKSNNALTASGNTGQIIGDATGNLIGPYPSKDEADITQYDIPGQKLDIASYPIPADGSTVKERDVVMFRPGFRCASNKIYVSAANGIVPTTPAKTLAINANGRPDNVVKVNAVNDGVYRWRVDCIDEESGAVREGDVWTFKVDSSL